tara:strand:+ start:1272 stop:1511 length:240 start_codon:yes stop_codon:yes gene_type:complete
METEMSTFFTALVTGLTGAIAFLFKIVMKQANTQSDLNARIGRLEGEHKGIQTLTRSTLQAVHQAIVEKCKPQEPPKEG